VTRRAGHLLGGEVGREAALCLSAYLGHADLLTCGKIVAEGIISAPGPVVRAARSCRLPSCQAVERVVVVRRGSDGLGDDGEDVTRPQRSFAEIKTHSAHLWSPQDHVDLFRITWICDSLYDESW